MAAPLLDSSTGLSPKGAATRAAIIDAALQLFRDQGFDGTTMRAIAAQAGVSLGNAYYYFASKEHLIQGFYDRAGTEHRVVARRLLDGIDDLDQRLIVSINAWIDTMKPYKAFAATFFRNAADPASPLSPFSAESTDARDAAVAFMADVVADSAFKPPKALRAELPELLWLYHMGIVLFWVHDQSTDSAKARLMLERTAPMVVRALQLSKLPLVRSMIEDLVSLIRELKGSP